MEEERKPTLQEAENISTIIGDGLSALNGARAVETGEQSNPAQDSISLVVSSSSSSTHEQQTALGSSSAITTVPSPQQQHQLVTTKQEPQDPLPVSLSPVPLANTQLVSDMNPPSTSTPTNQQQQRSIANLPPSIPAGKITNYCTKHPHIEVTLDGKELWDEFFRRGTEMIVNRAGR